jgi:hypothetical protein
VIRPQALIDSLCFFLKVLGGIERGHHGSFQGVS